MTFLDHYLRYATVNESPRSYHLWSGLSLMSAIVGRRVWTDENLFKVFPNLYVVLAGPPGAAKSTAKDIVVDFVNKHISKLPVCPAAITKEALVQMMAKDDSPCIQQFNHEDKVVKFSQMNILADELVSVIMCGGNPTGMIDFLTHIFSCSDYRETTKNKGDNGIKSPYVNMLACCTIDTLKQLVNQKVVSGGASRRCIFVVERKNDRPVPEIIFNNDQLQSYQYIADNWQRLRSNNGCFSWAPGVRNTYNDWYNENFYRIEKATSQTLQHFLRTKPAYIIKVSMLLALTSDHPLTHTHDTISRATQFVSSVEDGATRLFDNDGRNEIAAILDDVFHFIENQAGRVATKKVYAVFWKHCKDGNTGELDRLLDQLERSGKVKKSVDITESGSLTYYEAVKKGNSQ